MRMNEVEDRGCLLGFTKALACGFAG